MIAHSELQIAFPKQNAKIGCVDLLSVDCVRWILFNLVQSQFTEVKL